MNARNDLSNAFSSATLVRFGVAAAIGVGVFYVSSMVDPDVSSADSDASQRADAARDAWSPRPEPRIDGWSTSADPYLDIDPEGIANVVAGPVLGVIEGRKYVVTILGGRDEPRYTIADRDGEILAERLTISEVELMFPDLPLSALRAGGQSAMADVPLRD